MHHPNQVWKRNKSLTIISWKNRTSVNKIYYVLILNKHKCLKCIPQTLKSIPFSSFSHIHHPFIFFLNLFISQKPILLASNRIGGNGKRTTRLYYILALDKFPAKPRTAKTAKPWNNSKNNNNRTNSQNIHWSLNHKTLFIVQSALTVKAGFYSPSIFLPIL